MGEVGSSVVMLQPRPKFNFVLKLSEGKGRLLDQKPQLTLRLCLQILIFHYQGTPRDVWLAWQLSRFNTTMSRDIIINKRLKIATILM